MKLSIIIPTMNRPELLIETILTIKPQLQEGVELLIMDASKDFPNPEVSKLAGGGVRLEQGFAKSFDDAYDEAVNAARGEWVWLFSDDDWFKEGAVKTVMGNLEQKLELLILNAEVMDRKMTRILLPQWVKFENRDYPAADYDRMFAELGDLGTFVGSLVIRRNLWVERAKVATRYFGTRFITFAVPFLAPTSTRFVSQILVSVRFGHQNWITTSAQIIGEKMVEVVWSFPMKDWAKAAVRTKKPKLSELLLWKAVGSDISKHSALFSMVPRSVARAIIKLGLVVTRRQGGISDYMLEVTK